MGQSAPPEVLQKLTYLVVRHPQVKRVDTVRAYTFGVLYFVEVCCIKNQIVGANPHTHTHTRRHTCFLKYLIGHSLLVMTKY